MIYLLKECLVIKVYNKVLCVFFNVGFVLNCFFSRYLLILLIGRFIIIWFNLLVIVWERNIYVDSKNIEENEEFRSMIYILIYLNILLNDK